MVEPSGDWMLRGRMGPRGHEYSKVSETVGELGAKRYGDSGRGETGD